MCSVGSGYYEDDPEPGDLIEIFRFGYEHWAIYVGNGYVIHLALSCEFAGAGFASFMSVVDDKAWVKKELLREVLGENRYRVNNKYDDEYSPLPVAKIIRKAERTVGQERQYSLTSANCEHFVTELRYGVSRCDQVRNAVIGLGVGLGVLTLGVVFGAFIATKNKRQRDREEYK